MFRNFKVVSRVVFGRGCFNQLDDIVLENRKEAGSCMVFLVDDVFKNSVLERRLPLQKHDMLLWINVDNEPTTAYVDQLTRRIRSHVEVDSKQVAGGVIGIGGGSAMDLAKAVAIMLTNPGSAADYQGWDLVQHPAVYHMGVPTLSGTGAEVSRTTVLIGPQKKLGINSDYTVFDQIVLDPDLISGAPGSQRFYTGMDCYIHCIESLNGRFINMFSRSYGEKALALCREVFLNGGPDEDDKLMMASYFGGMSISYSQVGICHALSYGLSFVLGIHHGIGNCIAFDRLEKYYPEGVREFREMLERNRIQLPRKVVADLDEKRLEKMIDVSLILEPLWQNALGSDWKKKMPREKIKDIYRQM